MRDAAVLVPVLRDDRGVVRLILVRRTEGGSHGGQLAFPGGTGEAGDRTPLDTALREAREEIGLAADAVEVLAALPVTETRTTGYRIHPFLARVRRPPAWRLQASEIAELLEVRVDDLLRPEARGTARIRPPDAASPPADPFYRVGPYRLWGVSYRILHPLLPRLAAGEWPL